MKNTEMFDLEKTLEQDGLDPVEMDLVYARLRDLLLDAVFSADRDALVDIFHSLRRVHSKTHPRTGGKEGAEHQYERLLCFMDLAAQAANRIRPAELDAELLRQPDLRKLLLTIMEYSEVGFPTLLARFSDWTALELNRNLTKLELVGLIACVRSGSFCFSRLTPAGRSVAQALDFV